VLVIVSQALNENSICLNYNDGMQAVAETCGTSCGQGTWLSGPCSACDSRSAAMKAGAASPSAMTRTCRKQCDQCQRPEAVSGMEYTWGLTSNMPYVAADAGPARLTSEGPAGISMETMASLFCSSILAAVTYWLPGPSILSTCQCTTNFASESTYLPDAAVTQEECISMMSTDQQANSTSLHSVAVTFGQVSVPQAMAATACAPPARSTCVTPAFLAQYRTCKDVTTRHTFNV
jgi:hypothetical protein